MNLRSPPPSDVGNNSVKGSSRDYVAVYLEAADAASAPSGWKRYVEFRLGVVAQARALAGVDNCVASFQDPRAE